MFNNQEFSDFTLLTSDQEPIYVHKNILSIRSPVFSAMVNSKMLEGISSQAMITDISSKAVKELIRFIYCGRVDNIDDVAEDLLYAADKYNLEDLKPLCACALAMKLDKSNVLESYIMAELHDLYNLKKDCQNLIRWKYEDLQTDKNWKKLSPSMLKNIMDYLVDDLRNVNSVKRLTSNIEQPQPQHRRTTAAQVPPAQPNVVRLNINAIADQNVANNLLNNPNNVRIAFVQRAINNQVNNNNQPRVNNVNAQPANVNQRPPPVNVNPNAAAI
jgi:hypothetical protein